MRVEEEIFDDSNPVINPSLDVSLEPKGTPPYQIVVSNAFTIDSRNRMLILLFLFLQCGINEQGLGPVDWWNADDAEEEEEEED